MTMRRFITITESAEEVSQTPSLAFLDEVWANTTAHPFTRGQRVVGDYGVVEVRRDVDNRDTTVHISDILSLTKGKGDGNRLLHWLCELADRHGVTLTLFAKAYMTGDFAKGRPKSKDLAAWYGRNGFVKKQGQMVRPPKAVA